MAEASRRFEPPVLSGQSTRVAFGVGCSADVIDSIGTSERLLVLTTAKLRPRSSQLLAAIEEAACTPVATERAHDSTIDNISALIDKHRDRELDRVIAVGGGSVMDTAKAVAIGLRSRTPFVDVLRNPGNFAEKSLPVTCIPTTAGTGSEVTMWGTVWDTALEKKRSISHPRLYPEQAYVDPMLTLTMPAHLTAITGLDALSHALESLWNTRHEEDSDRCATEAVKLVFANLSRAVSAPADIEARTGMARAALLAGFAISRTATAAAHSVSYPMTIFHDIPHGQACSITLPWLLEWNAVGNESRMRLILESMGVQTPADAAEAVRALFHVCSMPTRLRDLGIGEDDLDRLLAHSFTPERMSNNLRAIALEDVGRMLHDTW